MSGVIVTGAASGIGRACSEALVEAGTPFRDAHEIVASSVRDGSYVAPAGRARPAPGPGGAAAAIFL